MAVRYVVELLIIFRDDEFVGIRSVLRNHGVDAQESVATLRPKGQIRIRLEKSDPRISEITRDLDALGSGPVRSYVPAFETWELAQAELVRLRVYGFCGDAFGTWAWQRRLPRGTRVMDKRAMGKQDIARTYAWNEFVISERLREILMIEGLTGWAAEPIQHANPKRDHFGPLYQLLATKELPPLAPETELELRKYDDPSEGWKHLYGTTALFEQGPLCYRRQDLAHVMDVNRTREVFLEVTVAHPYFILSQGTRQTFLRHRVRGDIKWEPVVILE